MARRLGIYTLGHFMSLTGPESFYTKKLWNPLLQNFESWELSQLSSSSEDQSIIEQSIEGMSITHSQILKGFFPLPERIACLERIRVEFLKNFDNLVQILSMEVHKPLGLARIECERCVNTLEATIALGKELLAKPPVLKATHGKVTGESEAVPRRISLALTPFNFPLNLSLHKIAPALLAGTPLIWRPSSKGQLSGLALVDILQAAKVPAGLIAFMPMSHESFWKLLGDPRIDAVSFTGSAKVGWEIHQKFKGPVLLELGGAAPIYLEGYTGEGLKKNLQAIANSAYSYAGQSCISAQTLFVEESLYDESRAALLEILKNFPVGKTWDEKTLCSSVIDDESAERIEKTLQESDSQVTRGAKIDIPHYVAPALVENPSDILLKEELFAPVLNLKKVKDFSDFANFANTLPHRLQCGVYSPNEQTLKDAETLDFGGININGSSSVRIDGLPYGGRGLAGLGMECPITSWSFFSPYKTIYRSV